MQLQLLARLVLAGAVALTLGACSSRDSDSSESAATDPMIIGAPDVDDSQPTMPSTNPPPADDQLSDSMNTDECSVMALNQWVDDAMRDFYIYADQVPELDIGEFASPEELIRNLRVAPDRFSNVASQVQQSATFDEGMQFGYGSNVQRDVEGNWRVFFVHPESPSDTAGVLRGDILLAVNDVPFDELTQEQSREFFGTGDEIRSPVFTFEREDGSIDDIVITRGEYRFFTVSTVNRFVNENLGISAGYLALSAFTEPTRSELDAAMQGFVDNPVDDMIIDLRYNGGGRTSIAQKMASQIAGASVTGQIFENLTFNDRYASNNVAVPFPADNISLDLPRVLFLVGDRTASASELLINGLRPYMDVVVLGSDTTVGKPFASRGRDLCDRRLNAMEILSTNADGASVAGGIVPDCRLDDDLQDSLGDLDESMLSGALRFLSLDECEVPTAANDASVLSRSGLSERDAPYESGLGMPPSVQQTQHLSIVDPAQ